MEEYTLAEDQRGGPNEAADVSGSQNNDAVVIVEAPDDETAARIALAQASTGGVRSQTLRAFTEDEYRLIAASLPGTQ